MINILEEIHREKFKDFNFKICINDDDFIACSLESKNKNNFKTHIVIKDSIISFYYLDDIILYKFSNYITPEQLVLLTFKQLISKKMNVESSWNKNTAENNFDYCFKIIYSRLNYNQQLELGSWYDNQKNRLKIKFQKEKYWKEFMESNRTYLMSFVSVDMFEVLLNCGLSSYLNSVKHAFILNEFAKKLIDKKNKNI